MTYLLLQPCANPRILVHKPQGGDDVYRLNALILTCAVGPAYSHSKQCKKQRLNLSKCGGFTLADTKYPSSRSMLAFPAAQGRENKVENNS